MNQSDESDARQLYHRWTTEQLIRATTVAQKDYEAESVLLMEEELSVRGVTPSEKKGVSSVVRHEMASERDRLTGIRGALLLFVVCVGLGSFSRVVVGLKMIVIKNSIFLVMGMMTLSLGAYGFYVASLLIRKRSGAPEHAQRFLVLVACLGLIEALAMWRVTHKFDLRWLLGFMGALLWIEYLGRSRRVAYTFKVATTGHAVGSDVQS